MLTTPRTAASAYQALSRISDPLASPLQNPAGLINLASQSSSNSSSSDFASLLKSAVNAVADKGRASEQKAAAFANGKGDLIEVVTAVAETGAAMDTLVSVRDRVISAYEDILKMPI